MWHFCGHTNSLEIEKVHKDSPVVVLNDYLSPYHDLLEKIKRPTMYVSRMKSTGLGVFKCLYTCAVRAISLIRAIPYPDGVYTPAWSVHSKATLLPLPPECTLQPHSEYYRCTLGCHSMDLVKLLTNRNTLQRHFKCTPGGVYTPLPLP